MMRKQVKKLDKDHLVMAHFDTCKNKSLITKKSPEITCLNTNWVTLRDTLEKHMLLPGKHEFLLKG